MLKRIAVGLGSGLLIGIVLLGGGGRIAMRLIALLAHRPTHFGIGATAGILMIGAILSLWLVPRPLARPALPDSHHRSL